MLATCRSRFVLHLPTRHYLVLVQVQLAVQVLEAAVVVQAPWPVHRPTRFRPGVVPIHRRAVRLEERPNCHSVFGQFAPKNCQNHLGFPRRRRLPVRVLVQVPGAPALVAEAWPSCLELQLVQVRADLVAIRLRFRPRHCLRQRRPEQARDYFLLRRQQVPAPVEEFPEQEADSNHRHCRHPNRVRWQEEHPRPELPALEPEQVQALPLAEPGLACSTVGRESPCSAAFALPAYRQARQNSVPV